MAATAPSITSSCDNNQNQEEGGERGDKCRKREEILSQKLRADFPFCFIGQNWVTTTPHHKEDWESIWSGEVIPGMSTNLSLVFFKDSGQLMLGYFTFTFVGLYFPSNKEWLSWGCRAPCPALLHPLFFDFHNGLTWVQDCEHVFLILLRRKLRPSQRSLHLPQVTWLLGIRVGVSTQLHFPPASHVQPGPKLP